MIRIPTHRAPTHPGEILLEEFLKPLGLTQRELANALLPYRRINGLVNGRIGMTPSTALRLAKYFRVSADFWMKLQLRWDLYHAKQRESKHLELVQSRAISAGPEQEQIPAARVLAEKRARYGDKTEQKDS